MKRNIFVLTLAALALCVSFTGCMKLFESEGSASTPAGFVKVTGTTVSTAITGSEVFINGRTVEIYAAWCSDHEVTQKEYQDVMGSNPSYFKNNPASGETQENRPVENVSWYDALVYCNKRSIQEGLDPCYTINGKTDPSEWGTVPTSNDTTWNAAECDFTANGYRLPTDIIIKTNMRMSL